MYYANFIFAESHINGILNNLTIAKSIGIT